MSTSQILQIIIESVVMLALIIGFFYEPIIAEWERKQGEKMLNAFKKRKKYRK